MPETRRINIQFPLGGENRRGRYAQKTPPFTTPRSINLRSVGPLERRSRGGSRPQMSVVYPYVSPYAPLGLQAVSYLDANGEMQRDVYRPCVSSNNLFMLALDGSVAGGGYLVSEEGNYIVTEDDNYIVMPTSVPWDGEAFPAATTVVQTTELNGRVYVAHPSDSLVRVDAQSGVFDSVSTAPSSQSLVCAYQERLIVSGLNNLFYMSRMGDDSDWAFVSDMEDVARPVVGRVGGAGMGGKITNLVAYKNQAVLLGTANSLWMMRGNIAADGVLTEVSSRVGPIAPQALVVTPSGRVVFLARDGLYSWVVGSDQPPERFSSQVVPEELQDSDSDAQITTMAYDHRGHGIYLFLVNKNYGPSYEYIPQTQWWIDLDNGALWPLELKESISPKAVTQTHLSGYSDLLMLSSDGIIRQFKDEVLDDSDYVNWEPGWDEAYYPGPLFSELLLGPIDVSGGGGRDGQVMELVGELAAGSAEVRWRLVMGESAEDAVDKASAAIDKYRHPSTYQHPLLLAPIMRDAVYDDVCASGVWQAGRNRPSYPRARGAWAVLWLSADKPWAYEAVSMVLKKRGRVRHG